MKSGPRRKSKAQTASPIRRFSPEPIFFVGKGGVGKTTLAAAYAIWRAHVTNDRVLLLSTDPAHSLGDVLERKLPRAPKLLKHGRGRSLTVYEIDAERRVARFMEQYREPLVEAIESGTLFRREEIAPLLSSTLPGTNELGSLLAIEDALAGGKFDCIVVDTAPFGHTLRLFQLPESFEKLVRFLDVASSRDAVLAAHFGGRVRRTNPQLTQWQTLLQSLVNDLRRHAKLMLVTTAEPFALQESARVAREIRHIDQAFRFSEIVLNRAVANEEGCSRCNDSRLTSSRAIAFLRQHFQGCPIRLAPDPGSPVLSARMLLQLGETVFGGRRRRLRPLPAPRVAAPKLSAAHWPAADHNLIAFVGKGGVGKTTVAAATAVNVRTSSTNAKVAICSTDPAPSVDDVFEQQVGNELAPALDDDNLLAAEIDAAAEFHTWATRMKQSLPGALTKNSGGIHVDLSYERRLFEALLDIVPPGLDEVFGVLRISKLLRHPAAPRNRQFHLILDMAPTGHALELLRTPDRILHWSRLLLKSLAPHRTLPFARDIGAEIAAFASDVRWLSKSLRDPQKFAAWVVLLAEPLPDRETERLLHQLRELQVPIAGIIINRVLLGERERTCARCRRIAAWQAATLQRFAKIAGAPARVFVVPEQARPPRGKHDLRTLTSKLRRLA